MVMLFPQLTEEELGILQSAGSFELINFKFINALTGYVCGYNGTVKYTTDFGTSWSGTSPTSATIRNIAVDGSTVYVSGFVSTQELYKSTDNGNTWTSISYAKLQLQLPASMLMVSINSAII